MNVFIIDDHPLIRDSMNALIQQHFPQAICTSTPSMEEAIPLFNQLAPDLILLDLSLPGMHGTEALSAILAHHDIPIIILSGSDNLLEMQKCLNIGAKGYLVKTEPAEVMLHAIKTVLNGDKYTPQALQHQASDINKKIEKAAQITPRQREILKLMHTGKRNKEIANVLNISEATVRVHCRDIFRILGANNRHQAVQLSLQLKII